MRRGRASRPGHGGRAAANPSALGESAAPAGLPARAAAAHRSAICAAPLLRARARASDVSSTRCLRAHQHHHATRDVSGALRALLCVSRRACRAWRCAAALKAGAARLSAPQRVGGRMASCQPKRQTRSLRLRAARCVPWSPIPRRRWWCPAARAARPPSARRSWTATTKSWPCPWPAPAATTRTRTPRPTATRRGRCCSG